MSKVNTLSLHPRRKPTRESMADNGNVSHRDGGGASAASRRKRLHKRKKKKSDPGIVHGRVRDLADWDPQYTGTESVGVKEHSVSSENLKKESLAVPQLASGDSSKSEASLLSPKKKRSRKKQSLQTPLRSSKSLESFDFTEKLHSVQDLSRSIEHLEKLKREVEETTRKKLEEKHRLEKKRQKIEHQRQLLKQQEEIEQRKLSQKLAEKERLKQEIIKKVGEEIYYRMELESQKNIQLAKLEEQKLELEKLHESIQKTQDSIKLGSLDTFGASVTEIGSPDASDSGQGLRESRDREPDLIKSVNQSIKRNSSAEMEREEPVGQEETILTSSGQTAEADTPVHFDQTSPHEGDISRSDSGRVDSGHFYTDYQDTEDKYCVEDATDYCESESETCDVEVVEDSETFNQFVCEEENADDPEATLESIGNPLDPYDGTLESYKANGTSMPGPENGAGDLEVTTDDQSQKAEEVEAKNGADVSEVASDSKNQEASDQQADTALSDALDSEVKDVQTAAVTEEEVPWLHQSEKVRAFKMVLMLRVRETSLLLMEGHPIKSTNQRRRMPQTCCWTLRNFYTKPE
ncbi:golgin subfamily A member 6-like protein 26 isoform X4 [Ptychodera flava]|uniref:golgin subfamily A member 6-like protein 26 isoform X4 n=1 Tax=Ptychodera flava TaxID=63121 RepID=UPI00396A9BB4